MSLINKIIHIADIHFGAINPKTQYSILKYQFIDVIKNIDFDILSIDGDLFDRKVFANSDTVYYAVKFVFELCNICQYKNAVLIIIDGTPSHDNDQTYIFNNLGYAFNNLHYYVIHNTSFLHINGFKILCIPEEYGKGKEYYMRFLSQQYDMCFMHGALVGGLYGCNKSDLENKRPVFDLSDFVNCKGPIIAGHVHEYMNLKKYMYYVSNPIRYKFGEEKEKGFGILLINDLRYHYYKFIPIESFEYNTIHLDCTGISDPEVIISTINMNTIDEYHHLRVLFSNITNVMYITIQQYFRTSDISDFIQLGVNQENKKPKINTTEEIKNKYSDSDYLFGNSSSFDKLSEYIFRSSGIKVSSEELKNIYNNETKDEYTWKQ